MKRLLSFATYVIGRIAIRLGGHAKAISWFRIAVRLDSSTRSLEWLAWSLSEVGALDDSAAGYANLVKLQPDNARFWFGLAGAQQDLGNHSDALASLDQAVALEHQNAVFHYTRGQSLIALGRIEEAASAYRLAVNIEPTYADAAGNLGAALGQLRRWDEAVRWHTEASRMVRRSDTDYNLGVALHELSRFDEAEQAFKRALQLEPGSGELLARLALSLAAQGRAEEAINMLETAPTSDPVDPCVGPALSVILLSEGKMVAATEVARAAITAAPDDPHGYIALGWAYLLAEQEAEALRAFETAGRMVAAWPEIDAGRACCLSRMGRHGEAVQLFLEVLARDRDYFDRDEMVASCFELSQREAGGVDPLARRAPINGS